VRPWLARLFTQPGSLSGFGPPPSKSAGLFGHVVDAVVTQIGCLSLLKRAAVQPRRDRLPTDVLSDHPVRPLSGRAFAGAWHRLSSVGPDNDNGSRFDELRSLIPPEIYGAFNPNDKTNLAPYRLLHFVVFAFFVVRLLPRDWPGLEWRIFRPAIKCGQQSLEVFCAGIFLSFAAHFVLVEISGAIWMQIAVSIFGILLMIALANYRSWSKNADKAPMRMKPGVAAAD
jgi:hypothetical protein